MIRHQNSWQILSGTSIVHRRSGPRKSGTTLSRASDKSQRSTSTLQSAGPMRVGMRIFCLASTSDSPTASMITFWSGSSDLGQPSFVHLTGIYGSFLYPLW